MFIFKRNIFRRNSPKTNTDTSSRHRWKYIFGSAVIALSTVTAAFAPFEASALNKTSALSPADQAKSYAYYLALRHCMSVGWFKNSTFFVTATKNSNMSANDALNWNFFNDHIATGPSIGNVYPPGHVIADNSVTVGVINEPTDGDTLCSNTDVNWLQPAAALWGYTSGPDLLCALGFVRDVGNCSQSTSGTNDFKLGHDNTPGLNVADVDKFWKSLGNADTTIGSITLGQYDLYYKSFTTSCGVSVAGTGDKVNYTIQTFDSGSSVPKSTPFTITDRNFNTGTSVRVYQNTSLTCQQLADKLKDSSSPAVAAYALYLSKNNGNPVGKVCGEPGVIKSEDGTVCPPTNLGTQSSCNVQGVGWIICPVVTFLAGIADSVFVFLSDNFLNTNVALVDQSGPAFKAWVIIRNLANVAFVIVFLVIIFSQLTGLGVTNYGVKKLLPRIVIAAILVNVSFYLCAIAVDISNILGHSLKDLLGSVGNQVTAGSGGPQDPLSGNNSLTNVAGSVLLIGASAVAGYALLGTIIPVLLAAVVALLMIFFLLIAREVIIVLLIVISPLAFVAYLLPNTESWFKKWRQALVAMLMLFPIISVVYGGSALASQILQHAFDSSVTANASVFGQIIGAAVLVLPLFAIPVLLKKSLDGIPVAGKMLNNLANKANGNLRAKGKESYANSLAGRGSANRKQARQVFRDKRYAARLTGGKTQGLNNVIAGGVPGVLSRIPGMDKLDKTPLGILGAQRQAIQRAATGTAASAQSEDVKQEMARLAASPVGSNANAIANHMTEHHATMTPTEMEAASDLLLSVGGADQYREIIGNKSITSRHASGLVASARRNTTDVRAKAADIANFMSSGNAAETLMNSGYDGSAIDATSVKKDKDGKEIPDSAVSYIEGAYSKAEAAKLVTMSPATATLAKNFINPEQAKIALSPGNIAGIKTDTLAVLRPIAATAPADQPMQVVIAGGSAPAPSGGGGTPSVATAPTGTVQVAGSVTPATVSPAPSINVEGVINFEHPTTSAADTSTTIAPEVSIDIAGDQNASTLSANVFSPSGSAPVVATPVLVGTAAMHNEVITQRGGIENLSDQEVQTIRDSAERWSREEDDKNGNAEMTAVGLQAIAELERRQKSAATPTTGTSDTIPGYDYSMMTPEQIEIVNERFKRTGSVERQSGRNKRKQ